MLRFKNKAAKGFSLVELIITIILVAVLSIIAAPKLIGASGYSAYSLRQEFISELRKAQQLALTNPDRSYQIDVTDSSYQIKYTTSSNAEVSLENKSFPNNTHIQLTTLETAFDISFDGLGRVTIQTSPSTEITCSGACLDVVADDVLSIYIESEGYIHEG